MSQPDRGDTLAVARHSRGMKWIDIPPTWLVACLAVAWWVGQSHPLGLSFGGSWVGLPAGLLVGGGLILMGLALIEMRKWRTTVIPHHVPTHMVTSGIYKRTRNPIYVGDLMILAGMVLYWDAPLALPLVPILMWVLEKRFIIPEEARLRSAYKADFFRYTQKTRRWV